MGKLFKNELLKIKYNKTVWIFGGISVVLVVLLALMDVGASLSMELYGYTTSFAYIRICGTFVIMFLAPVAGTLFTQELQQGTMYNTLSCGVSRRQYFAVKAICVFVINLSVYLLCLVEFVCIRTAIRGWRPTSYTYSYPYPHYGLVNLVYHSGCILLLCTYTALYIMVAVSVKKPAIVYLSGAVATMGEATAMIYIPAYKGVIPALIAMYDAVVAKKVLTPEFAGLLNQGAVMLIVFLTLAYLIFTKRDIN